YMKYRNRQPREQVGGGSSASQDQKWPEYMEQAFCRALVRYRPMGRKKLAENDHKSRGRNELMADFIQEMTGEKRTRKQVSSHIQVLKVMVKHD
ncbi:TEA-domain-containing protein, partial [Aulographum hederae CBS 113979]